MDSRRRADAVVGGLAVLDLGVHLALAPRYGFHRDELYLLACGQRLDWGSLDHGPLAPALARLAAELGGATPAGQRVADAVLGAFLVWLTALCARRLGGGLGAQAVAAGSVVIAPIFIYAAGVHGTNAIDQVCWSGLGFIVVHALTGRPSGWHWAAFGLVLGAGLLGKYTVLLWAMALGLALWWTYGRARVLRAGWLGVTVLVAGLVALPNLWWQHGHGWPALEFLPAHHQAVGHRWSALLVLAQQPLLLGPLSLVVAGYGLAAGLRGARPVGRVLGRAFVVVAVLVLVAPGKPYYLAPAYPMMLALGAVAAERLIERWPRTILLTWAGAGAVAFTLTLPVLPRTALARWPLLRAHPEAAQFADWPDLVAQVARAYHDLPAVPGIRRGILTDSYGTAAALERFGPAHHLPAPLSGANGYFLWGAHSPEQPDELLVAGYPPALLASLCRSVQPAGRVTSPLGLDNRFDFPRDLHLCRGLERPLRAAWPELRRFD